MSYDIRLKEPITGESVEFEQPHQMRGGTYAMGGSTEAWLNVTYNDAQIFWRVLGEGGIRSIYGKSGAECIPILKDAMSKLADDVADDYWKATEGNAKSALAKLLAFAQMRPDAIFDGD